MSWGIAVSKLAGYRTQDRVSIPDFVLCPWNGMSPDGLLSKVTGK
jgi:hypothetical protein